MDGFGKSVIGLSIAIRYIEKRFLVNLHVVWSLGMGIEVTPYEATLRKS